MAKRKAPNQSCKIDLRESSIPIYRKEKKTALDYGQIEFDLGHELCNEPLIAVKEFGIESHSYYARKDGCNPPYYKSFSKAPQTVYVRESVAKNLERVNNFLYQFKVELVALDGWRPISLQTELWDHFLARAKNALENPSDEDCVSYAGEYCSNPGAFNKDDSTTWPTHSTGGAIDLTLRSLETKEYLFFGSVFDEASSISYTNHYEVNIPQSTSEIEAKRNRRLLYWSMIKHGFSNYPLEWWHFDLGTQMWVMNNTDNNESKAYYGYIEL